ncbi:uncharacterized protein LOC141907524 [Tubulanus polymorphus]|uniref:uncharacterized protein LOC141907524 n=1 Tax=Tubulanus polymorphus TaxID=672921 RepID=UPI003DA65688
MGLTLILGEINQQQHASGERRSTPQNIDGEQRCILHLSLPSDRVYLMFSKQFLVFALLLMMISVTLASKVKKTRAKRQCGNNGNGNGNGGGNNGNGNGGGNNGNGGTTSPGCRFGGLLCGR